MTDIDGKSSPSLGATESETRRGGPPSPSPSAALPMRVTHVQPQPTPSSAFQAIAELNRGFEQDTRNLEALQGFNFFPAESLAAWGNLLGRLQAEASVQLLEALEDRLMNNALYHDRLYRQRERQLKDPNDVLLEAERRKQELAAEQQLRERESEEDS